MEENAQSECTGQSCFGNSYSTYDRDGYCGGFPDWSWVPVESIAPSEISQNSACNITFTDRRIDVDVSSQRYNPVYSPDKMLEDMNDLPHFSHVHPIPSSSANFQASHDVPYASPGASTSAFQPVDQLSPTLNDSPLFDQWVTMPHDTTSHAAVAASVLPSQRDPSSHSAEEQYWELSQTRYRGNNRGDVQNHGPLPTIAVNVAASDALPRSGRLQDVLADPFGLAFPATGDVRGRERQKGTQHVLLNNVVPFHSKQFNEYAAGDQKCAALIAASKTGQFDRRKDRKSVPLRRATLVEKTAILLEAYMAELKRKGTPPVLRGHEVDFNHVLIVDIYKPTPAAYQPTLAILPEYRHLYQ
ncbi:hypothetical protein C2E23DRAFT_886659 [Lenzites betulinus]|nr:hypothetical protein C2E23DRAFT_886659 [Lenzites betulinus]